MTAKSFNIPSTEALTGVVTQLLPLIQKAKKVAFLGEMGVGKTTFIKVLCQALGVQDHTSSPTFSIINEYQANDQRLYHIDLYRLKQEEEAFSIGLMELLEDPDCYCFVEWPQLIADYFPADTLWIQLELTDSGERLLKWGFVTVS